VITPLRVLIAVGCLAIGAIHLRLYFDSYQDVPIENIGRSFLFNAAASVVAAVVVLVWASRYALVAPLLLADTTLVAFGLSRTDRGIFNFNEEGWNPSPDAAISVAVEVATGLLVIVAFLRERPVSTS
jgi:hypothetical protein